MRTIGKSLLDVSAFSVLLFLFLFTCTLMGMEFFSHKVKYNDKDEFDLSGESPRYNFDNFLFGMTTLFVFLTGDSWNVIMFKFVRMNFYLGLGYFMVVMMLGRFMLLNLFLAILLKNFDENPPDLKKEEAKKRKAQE